MIKTKKKNDFTSQTMREMQSGDIIIVTHDDFRKMDSTLSQIRLFKKRNTLPNGIEDFKVEYDTNSFAVQITAV